MQLTGRLKSKFNPETIQTKKGAMTKMGFVIETEGKYPKEIYIETWQAPLISFLNDTNIGVDLNVEATIQSRSYQKKDGSGIGYFTSINASNATTDRQVQVPNQMPQNQQYNNQVNNAFQPKPKVTPSGQPMDEEDDGLPF
jgi:single-stranded DNA-binding protein